MVISSSDSSSEDAGRDDSGTEGTVEPDKQERGKPAWEESPMLAGRLSPFLSDTASVITPNGKGFMM